MSIGLLEKIGIREDLLWQMPGYIGFGTKGSRMIAANKKLTNVLGFSSTAGIANKHYSEMMCDAAAASPVLIEQDQQALKQLIPFNSLQIHRYADEELHVLFAKHSPVFIDGEAQAVLYNAVEFDSGPFKELALTLFKSDKLARQVSNCESRFYEIGHYKKNTNFTRRELECLFYLIRGKSLNEASAILGISKRTVETHVENMKVKNNIYKKSDLIELALSHGLAYFIPESILP